MAGIDKFDWAKFDGQEAFDGTEDANDFMAMDRLLAAASRRAGGLRD